MMPMAAHLESRVIAIVGIILLIGSSEERHSCWAISPCMWPTGGAEAEEAIYRECIGGFPGRSS